MPTDANKPGFCSFDTDVIEQPYVEGGDDDSGGTVPHIEPCAQASESSSVQSVDELRASLVSKREALQAAAAELIDQPAEMRDWFNMPASRIVTHFDSQSDLEIPM